MRTVRYLRAAATALRRHRERAQLIQDKIDAFARDPGAQANDVKRLRGSGRLRLRIGDFRAILEVTETEVLVVDVGPRGSIYE